MKKDLQEEINRIKSLNEQIDDVTHRAFSNPQDTNEEPQQMNEIGVDTPLTVTQEVIVVLTNLKGSPEFLQKVLDHVGGEERGFTMDSMGERMSGTVDERLEEIIQGIPNIPREPVSSDNVRQRELDILKSRLDDEQGGTREVPGFEGTMDDLDNLSIR